MNHGTDEPPGVRVALRQAVTRSMKARDREAATTYRSALAAIHNAEAVPVETMPRAGAIEGARVGAGAADAARRELSEADMRRIVRVEADQLRAAAAEFARIPTEPPAGVDHQGPPRARALLAAAELLDAVLTQPPDVSDEG